MPDDSLPVVVAKAAEVRPTPRQIAWQRDELSAFIHFGMNTFTDREWGDGAESPQQFNPTELDARQWVLTAKAAGIKRMILTAKHHDGFCLWPSKYTTHCVKSSPWKAGKGDVVKEFVDACRAEDMHYGIYISPWDRHEPTYGDSPKYNRYFLNQLQEVLTTYPGISEVWFDGACAEGPNGKRQEYDWRAYWSLIRQLAPNAVISVRGPDVRWCGNEAGHVRKSEWSVLPFPGSDETWETSDQATTSYTRDIYGDDLGGRDQLMRSRLDRSMLVWYPAQVNTSIRPGWFYHKGEDNRVRTLEDLLSVYFGSVGGNGQFLLNIPPDQRGLFHEHDVARLTQLGAFLKATFAENLAKRANLNVESSAGTSIGEIATVLDGDPDTFWTTTDHPTEVVLTMTFAEPVHANCLMLQEHIASGQRIEEFEVEIATAGAWRPVAKSTVIGYKRLVRFPGESFSKLRIRFGQFRIRPTLAELGLYLAPAILKVPEIDRDLEGNVVIKAPEGAYSRYTLDGSDPTDNSQQYSQPIPLPAGGEVRARAYPLVLREIDADIKGSLAHTTFGLAKSKWKVVNCDSQDSIEGTAQQAIDDDVSTFWHSSYRDRVDPLPHHITVDLGETVAIRGFAYTPRHDQWDGGIIMQARFDVSQDGRNWTSVIEEASFDNIVNSRQQQLVTLPTSVNARFFRMTALQSANNTGLASAAEISVLTE